jgi:phosphotransferase system HPr (HPr) family protein
MTLERKIEIKNEHGLHLRAAAMIARAARDFDSDIVFHYNDKTADAKSTVGLVTLGAPYSGEIVVRACGEDADCAMDAISMVLHNDDFICQSFD